MTTPAAQSNPDQTTIHGATQWTADTIRTLGTVTTVPVAASIFGLSRSVAYDLVRTGQFPVPVLRFGTRYRIPVAAILTALHMPLGPADDLTDRRNDASIDHARNPQGVDRRPHI